MRRKDLLFWMIAGGCLLPGIASAQDSDDEEARKKAEINEIKLSENTIYADVVEMVTDDNEAVSLAQQKSINMLQMHVIEMFAKRMNMPPEDVQEIWDVIDDKCQNIVVKKGDLFRVFTYIVKDAVGLGRKKPKKGDVEKYLTPDEDKDLADAQKTLKDMEKELNAEDSVKMVAQAVVPEAVKMDSAAVEAPKTVVVPVAEAEKPAADTTETVEENAAAEENTAADETALAEAPKDETVSAEKEETETQAVIIPMVADKPKTDVKEEEKEATAPVTPVPVTPAPAVAETPKPEPIPAAPEVQEVQAVQAVPELVKQLMAQSDMKSLLSFLNAEKDKHTLMYGSMKSMIYKDKCYIVIVNKSTKMIETVLGKGFEDRINYKTMKTDDLDNYTNSNFSAVLVQEY